MKFDDLMIFDLVSTKHNQTLLLGLTLLQRGTCSTLYFLLCVWTFALSQGKCYLMSCLDLNCLADDSTFIQGILFLSAAFRKSPHLV